MFRFAKPLSAFALSTLFVTAFAANKDKAAPATLEIDPAVTEIKWEGKKVTGKHNGKVPLKSGQLQLKGNDVVGGNVEVDVSRLTVDDLTDEKTNAKLVGHLKSDDFFSTEKHPTAQFVIKKVTSLKGMKDATHTVSGDLTIKGKTNPVTFPATIHSKEGVVTAQAKIPVDRTKWDIRYGSGKFFQGLGDKVIYDEFNLDLNLKTKN